MTARNRKLIGLFAIPAFVLVYAGAMGWIGAQLPPIQWLQFAFYAVAGIGWGVPILPFLKWMNAGR